MNAVEWILLVNYLGIVVIVQTDVCECPEEEDHDCERGGLTDGAEHQAQVVVEDEGAEELQRWRNKTDKTELRQEGRFNL